MIDQLVESGKRGQVDEVSNELVLTKIDKQVYDTLDANKSIQEYFNNYSNLKYEINNSEFRLPKFWISYIEMVELLLNVIYACRAGLWDLLLECIREIIPYAFAYDNINYARYLSVMLGDMLALEYDFPEICEQFLLGNFTAQLSDGVFSRVETDKVIEMTLNKDTKTPGGTTGFSTTLGAVHRSTSTKIPSPARITKDETAVQFILSILHETFVHPFADMPLLSISGGNALDEVASEKMLTVKNIGKELMKTFNKERLEEGHTLYIFDRMKKQKLPTFSSIPLSKAAKHKARLVAIESTKELLESLQEDHAFIVDGMAYVRQLKSGGLTFNQFSQSS